MNGWCMAVSITGISHFMVNSQIGRDLKIFDLLFAILTLLT